MAGGADPRGEGQGPRGRIGERIAAIQGRLFVGREPELARIESLVLGREPAFVYLHGPGGIGKTTLLARLSARVEESGLPVTIVSGPELRDSVEGVVRVFSDLPPGRRLLGIDGWDELGAAALPVREDALQSLSEDWSVVLTGRRPPDAEWWGSAWMQLLTPVRLQPLSGEDSRLLLERLNVEPSRAEELVRWAAGVPLALAMGAAEEDFPGPGEGIDRLVSRLSRRLLQGTVSDGHLGTLATAATARVTTPEVIGAARPESDAESEFRWLSEQTYTEDFAGGLRLHSLVGTVVRREASTRHPQLVAETRRRLADHFWAEAVRTKTPVVPDLWHLVEDPDVAWGLGWDDEGRYSLDTIRTGDVETLHSWWSAPSDSDQWHWISRYLREAPHTAGVVRDAAGRISGVFIAMTPLSAPAFADEDPRMGPWLEYARRVDPTGNSVLWRIANDLTDQPEAPTQGLLGAGGIRRSGLPNPRRVYLPINDDQPRAVAFAAAIGAQMVPGLSESSGRGTVYCYEADLGPGGTLGAYRAVVYAELGLPAPVAGTSPDAVRDILRNWHDVAALASSPLADGTEPADRAASIRQKITSAIEVAFGPSPEDRLLREVLEEGYIARSTSQEATAARLGISRAAYFRRQSQAVARLAACVSS
jgi:hypothetical protein